MFGREALPRLRHPSRRRPRARPRCRAGRADDHPSRLGTGVPDAVSDCGQGQPVAPGGRMDGGAAEVRRLSVRRWRYAGVVW
jgi:hypothetical protein